MTPNLQPITASKRAFRQKLAALPVAEKLRMLDALRARTVAIRGRGARPGTRVHEASASKDGAETP